MSEYLIKEIKETLVAMAILLSIAICGFSLGMAVKKHRLYLECMDDNYKQGFSEQRAEQRCTF